MFRIFGPPGTGKTTKLLDMVDQNLSSGIASSDIAFLAFTRKAANEAKERASLRFNLDPKKDLFYFRTLHSLALTLTDIRTEQVLQKRALQRAWRRNRRKLWCKQARRYGGYA